MSDDFVSDAEIARRWKVSQKTARIAIRQFEKRPGFPPKDPLFAGKRFWPAVQAFMLRRSGVSIAASVADGEEAWNATRTKDRRGTRAPLAATR